jgi:beta-phosphoglucomutase-like phosphatase (HAD superfamily)
LKAKGKRIAIFSTMDRKILEPVVNYRNFQDIAEVIVAGNDVEHRKPHPAGVLKTLELLGIDKEDHGTVVYIGDKDTDVQAANAAGIDGILYYPEAHHMFYDLEDLSRDNPANIITDWCEIVTATAPDVLYT